jgi:cytochrome c biogenesis protein CcmG, thiol:disulfide interchange protein DsbE
VKLRRRWVVAIATLILVQLVGLVLWQRLDQDRRSAGLPVVMEPRSEPGHDLSTERVDGSSQPVSARSDRFQLVHFWATWCPPCRKELPTLLTLERRERDRLRVWIISTDSDWAPVREFFRGRVPSSVVRDAKTGYRAYGVSELPDSYLLAPNGRVVARFAGGQHWSSPKMRKTLDLLMSTPAAR